MFKKAVLPIGIIFLGSIAISALIVAKPKPTPQPPEEKPAHIAVSVIEAEPATARLAVTTQGTVEPKREIDLVAQVSGQIVSVDSAFATGGFFNQQQQLIQIDDRDYQVALLNAEARLADAQRRLAEEEGLALQAKREWRELDNQNANNLFMRKPQLAAAKANLKFAEADLKMAQLNLERTRITVPFDGRVKQIYADVGQFVSAGNRLATVYDSAVFEVRLPLTEKQAALVQLPLTQGSVGAHRPEKQPAVTISGQVAGTAHQWQGRLTRTDAFVDANSRMYFAIAEVPNAFSTASANGPAPLPILPGLFVEAIIEGKELANIIQLPRSALFQRNQVLSLDSAQKTVNHTVEVLRKSETHVWVRAQLSDKTLITLEKQALTPAGTQVVPLLSTGQRSPSVAQNTIETPLSNSQAKE